MIYYYDLLLLLLLCYVFLEADVESELKAPEDTSFSL